MIRHNVNASVWSHFFGDDPILLAALNDMAEIKSYSPKECIFSQQDSSRDVFYMLKGRAKAVSLSVDGQEVWLETIEPGFLFGEVAALGVGNRTASIFAKSKAEVARFRGADFINLMERFGSIGVAVSRLLVKRIERTTIRMCELSSLSAPGRIYAELLRLAEYEEESNQGYCTIKIAPPNTEIAVLVNSTRETVSRTMSDLVKKGIITKKGARITIPSPDALMNMIS